MSSLNDILGRLHNAKIDLDTGHTKAEVSGRLSGVLRDLRRIVESQPAQKEPTKPQALTASAEPVGWQQRHKTNDGEWTEWYDSSQEAFNKATTVILNPNLNAKTQYEYRALYASPQPPTPDPAPDREREELASALQADRHYRNGLMAGWNFGVVEDRAGYEAAMAGLQKEIVAASKELKAKP